MLRARSVKALRARVARRATPCFGTLRNRFFWTALAGLRPHLKGCRRVDSTGVYIWGVDLVLPVDGEARIDLGASRPGRLRFVCASGTGLAVGLGAKPWRLARSASGVSNLLDGTIGRDVRRAGNGGSR
ncbi:hypothetical protein Arub01_16840 [Actinomadura rubrobrunea]|uniref:Uncharacterized protein n=1 Tax=Actinomadura rubrobrunea TaxID=115335 RepID=A0A9W6UW94_9ACTN|nr:hypothetical protein Arub01_16840 [Actinomadura rubrobrunea]